MSAPSERPALSPGPRVPVKTVLDELVENPATAPVVKAAQAFADAVEKHLSHDVVSRSKRTQKALHVGLLNVPAPGEPEYTPSLASMMRAINMLMVVQGERALDRAVTELEAEWQRVVKNGGPKTPEAEEQAQHEREHLKKIPNPKYEVCLRVSNRAGMRLVLVRQHGKGEEHHQHGEFRPWKKG